MNTASRNDILELLPWHENGTLRDDEAEAVRALLACDLDANRQSRELRALRSVLADEPILSTNMAMNLQRLHARIDPPRRIRPAWFTPLALAATVMVAVSAGMGLFEAGERAGRFHTLTAPAELPPVPAGSVLYRVDVAAGVDARQLAELAGGEVRVLQGPSERGVALLAVPSADADVVLARLRADQRLRFVTSVPR